MTASEDILGNVADFVRGITFKPQDVVPVGSPSSAVCMRTKNVQADLDLSDIWGIPETLVRREDQFLIPGDILVSSANSWNLVGKCCCVHKLPWKSTFGGFISVLRAKAEKVHPRYLYHWFSSEKTQAMVRRFGQKTTSISNLNIQRCLDLRLPTPGLLEQRRIAEILDKADEIRRKRAAALALTDDLLRSVFLDMFGDPVTNPKKWPAVPLKSLVPEDDSINYGVVQPGNDVAAGIPIVRVGDFVGMRIDRENLKRIDPRIESAYKRSRLNGDEILIACVGSIGKVALSDSSLKGCNIVRAVARVKPRPSVNRFFLAHYLCTPFIQAYFGKETRTVSQPTLNIKQIDETPVYLPPAARQKDFEKIANAISQAEVKTNLATIEAENLFNSLVQRAFRGEL